MGDVSQGFFITGTDTGVGKTMLTCLLARELSVAFFSEKGRSFAERKTTLARVAAYKPVCSGATYREGEAPAEPRATDDTHPGNQLNRSLDSGSLSPASDIAIHFDLTAGERARVRGPHSLAQLPHPGPLPPSGVPTESHIDCGGEGAEWAAYPVPSKPDSRSPTPIWSDVEALYAATNAAFLRDRICPQTFLAPLSPPAAAALEGREVDEALLLSGYHWLAERAEMVLVEGAGGFYSPISKHWLNADLAERIGLPVLIVAPNRLGTINHTLLTIEAVRQRGLNVAGVILNQGSALPDSSPETNAAEIQDRGRVRIWGEIPFTLPAELQQSRLPESMLHELRHSGFEVDG